MQRVLLKLSGEALAGEKKTGFDDETIRKVAFQVKQLVEDGVQVGIVIGGGNFWILPITTELCPILTLPPLLISPLILAPSA